MKTLPLGVGVRGMGSSGLEDLIFVCGQFLQPFLHVSLGSFPGIPLLENGVVAAQCRVARGLWVISAVALLA